MVQVVLTSKRKLQRSKPRALNTKLPKIHAREFEVYRYVPLDSSTNSCKFMNTILVRHEILIYAI